MLFAISIFLLGAHGEQLRGRSDRSAGGVALRTGEESSEHLPHLSIEGLRESRFFSNFLHSFEPEDETVDPYAWLEDVKGKKSLDWVKAQNHRTLNQLGNPTKSDLNVRLRSIVESDEKIPYVKSVGDKLYNLWKDKTHVRGLWRRTSLVEFRKNEPVWETVLDLDALGKAEGESWVWKGFRTLDEGPGKLPDLALLFLSRGGADAFVVKEFNLTSKAFLPAPGGFVLPEAKTDISYLDRNTVLVGTNLGPGSMTSSGYARAVRSWKRGTDVTVAPIVFEGEEKDVSVHVYREIDRRGCIYEWHNRGTSFYTSERSLKIAAGPGASANFTPLDVPADAVVFTFADQMLLKLRSDYTPAPGKVFLTGALIAMPVSSFMIGERQKWVPLFTPSANTSLIDTTFTMDYLVLRILDAVKPRLVVWHYTPAKQWVLGKTEQSDDGVSSIDAWAYDARDSNALWVQESGFLQPYALSWAASPATLEDRETLKELPEMFKMDGLAVTQEWATSKDGTRVPYFLVRREGVEEIQPTLLYGYGGFLSSQLPFYSGLVGAGWLERGGAYALANIRGGGEFGPRWHKAALKQNRHKSFEDFAAVANHLISTGVTTSAKLGIMGGSNGGLLVGNMLVRYPNLFGAVVCQVPLLDMKRYTKLLAGSSWIAEYGDPDNATEWEFIRHYSPYHNVVKGMKYPPVLFTTSTRDDRVHPAHARKMTAKLQALGGLVANHTFLYENVEGGHGGSADARQLAFVKTLEYNFLWDTLSVVAEPTEEEEDVPGNNETNETSSNGKSREEIQADLSEGENDTRANTTNGSSDSNACSFGLHLGALLLSLLALAFTTST
jgi:prolyl oligopeptidase